jgi:LIM domain
MPPRSPPWESPYSPSSAEYLASLRKNRPVRPTGSRPAPFKSRTSIDQHVFPRSESAMSLHGAEDDAGHVRFEESQDIPRSQSNRHSMLSERSVPNLRSTKGRPLVQVPSEGIPSMRGRKVSPTATVEPFNKSEELVYKESGTRWLERQEAHALRQALEVMDAKEERRIHSAAQDEAADLVWQHRHPGQAEQEKVSGYRNPDLSKKLKSHLVRGAHDRSHSDGNIALSRADSESRQLRTVSEGSNNSQAVEEHTEPIVDKTRSKKNRLSDAMQHLRIASGQAIASVDTGKLRNFSGGRRRMSGQRNASNKSTTFPNPEDKIFEEPEEMSMTREINNDPQDESLALKTSSQNSLHHITHPLPHKAETMSSVPKARPNPFDRRRKQAEQPKAAPYTSNVATPPPAPESEHPPTRDGREIRSDDIRAATSMKRSDRSPKLPTPTAVSDRAGRPIVSFDPAWKAPSETKQEQRDLPVRPRPEPPAVTVSAPAVPTIHLPDDDDPYDPPAGLSEPSAPGIPTFSFDGPEAHDDAPTVTALPTIISPAQPPPARPLPQHRQSMPVKPTASNTPFKLPWLNRGAPTATCASCTLPISGRIVTASDASQQQKARFHPECFSCAHCSTALECVAFYPEPENKRQERLEQDDLQSENDALRFYCHLDFHEFFSPRCRSCKTPIEGEVILAAGGEYHVGHFFCAECGDPFDSSTPFVEKGGYAYCVSCHRKRTSGRCRGCKALILDEGSVQALGGDWHEQCFKCFECVGDFGDEGRFYLREVEVEVTAKERRRGMEKKFEEKPVCQGCEELRLKQ